MWSLFQTWLSQLRTPCPHHFMLQMVHCTKLCDDIHICGHLNVFIILLFLEMTINVLGTNVPIFSSSKVVTNEEIFISCEALILSSPSWWVSRYFLYFASLNQHLLKNVEPGLKMSVCPSFWCSIQKKTLNMVIQ